MKKTAAQKLLRRLENLESRRRRDPFAPVQRFPRTPIPLGLA